MWAGGASHRREQDATASLLAAGAGVRSSELLALRVNDLDFEASTLRVDESSGQQNAGKIGPCKNVTPYRTVLLRDTEGQKAMWELRRFLGNASNPNALVFHLSCLSWKWRERSSVKITERTTCEKSESTTLQRRRLPS